MTNRERHIERMAAHISRAFDASPANPALRAENLRRAAERDADYHKWNDLSPPRWEKPVQFTEIRDGFVTDYQEAAE